MAPLRVFVSVGTDHHRFDRLIEWVERWVGAQSAESVNAFVQYGTSRKPRDVPASSLISGPELVAHMRESDAVVLQGGPGGIIDSLRCGIRPIVVPRLSSLGEHVDDHQVTFARHMARRGLVVVAESEMEITKALDAIANNRSLQQVSPHPCTPPAETINRFDSLVARLLKSPGGLRQATSR